MFIRYDYFIRNNSYIQNNFVEIKTFFDEKTRKYGYSVLKEDKESCLINTAPFYENEKIAEKIGREFLEKLKQVNIMKKLI